jgi:putative ABC transport system permease protein
LTFIEETWKSFAPRNPFSYFFIDDEFGKWYNFERRIGTVFSASALLAVLISCFGIFGLASFSVERRAKEIGIRKVLGASSPEVFRLLSREFLKWILVANLFAWPVAYFIMNQWLGTFPYRVNMAAWVFLLSGLIGLGLALFTVSYRSIKAAVANPVDCLRYE